MLPYFKSQYLWSGLPHIIIHTLLVTAPLSWGQMRIEMCYVWTGQDSVFLVLDSVKQTRAN